MEANAYHIIMKLRCASKSMMWSNKDHWLNTCHAVLCCSLMADEPLSLICLPRQLNPRTMITCQQKPFTLRPQSWSWKEASLAALQQSSTIGFSCSMLFPWSLLIMVTLHCLLKQEICSMECVSTQCCCIPWYTYKLLCTALFCWQYNRELATVLVQFYTGSEFIVPVETLLIVSYLTSTIFKTFDSKYIFWIFFVGATVRIYSTSGLADRNISDFLQKQ